MLINELDSDTKQYDYWFWGSIRTNPYGFADDRQILVNKGQLRPQADLGKACYGYQFNSSMLAIREESHKEQKATQSRSDVHATGKWLRGEWQILLTRRLKTGYHDDIEFEEKNQYQLSLLQENGQIKPLLNFKILEVEP